jgi:hypothetical protein
MSEGRTDTGLDGGLTIAEAAAVLGVKEDAVRKRIKRGTVLAIRGADGVLRVHLPDQPPSKSSAKPADATGPILGVDALLAEKDARITDLKHELELRAEEIRRRDILLAQLNDQLKALRATTDEPRDKTTTETENQPLSQPTAQPRPSFWERLFWGSQGRPRG